MLRRHPLEKAMQATTSLSLAACIVAVVACSSATSPQRPPPTILVTNAWCQAGPCRSLEIRVFVEAFTVPQPPIGFEILGYVRGPKTCLQFPAKWTLSVGTAGGPTTVLTWTPDNPLGVILVAQDTAFGFGPPYATQAQFDSSVQGVWPYTEPPGILGSSPGFVPGTSPGWSLTFPLRSQHGAAEPTLTPAAPCPSPQQPPPE